MHYEIDGITIKTEYAAKTLQEANRHVLEWISSLPNTATVIDYGCGKFRYAIPLASQVRCVHAIDSIHQISRTQTIAGTRTNLLELAGTRYSNIIVHEVRSLTWQCLRVDAVLCANVLSAIPVPSERVAVLSRLRGLLKETGQVLVCVQYRNSYFNDYGDRSDSKPYADGWVLKSRKGFSFYGIINPDTLTQTVVEAGFSIDRTYVKDGSAYVLARLAQST